MAICPHCGQRLWPFLVVLFVAVFVAFLTGLTLSVSGLEPHVAFGWSVAVMLGVFVLLAIYVVNCMSRHCGHGPGRRH